ncbi:MAG TPA: hypothetical protein QGF02_02785 [Candidatus Babeliales bacterium]|nr:hypothetical protein [Candidatus Babeliales bacterium]
MKINVSKKNQEGNEMKIKGLLALGLLLAGSSCMGVGGGLVPQKVKDGYHGATGYIGDGYGYVKGHKAKSATGALVLGGAYYERERIQKVGSELTRTFMEMDNGKKAALALMAAGGYAACKANRNSQAALAEIKAMRAELGKVGTKVDDLTTNVGELTTAVEGCVTKDGLAEALRANDIRTAALYDIAKAKLAKKKPGAIVVAADEALKGREVEAKPEVDALSDAGEE